MSHDIISTWIQVDYNAIKQHVKCYEQYIGVDSSSTFPITMILLGRFSVEHVE